MDEEQHWYSYDYDNYDASEEEHFNYLETRDDIREQPEYSKYPDWSYI